MNTINDSNDIRKLVAFARMRGEEADRVSRFMQTDFSLEKVKSNPKRSIFRMTDEHGSMLYLKLFSRQFFPFDIFRFYAAKEYRIAKALEAASVPVVRYLAWAKLENGGGFCVSEGVPHAVSGRQYFFQTALSDDRKRGVFLECIAELARGLYKNHFYHSDFHTSNILFDQEREKACLVDPWGIREVFGFMEYRKAEMCSPWMELRAYLSDDEVMQGILSSSLGKNKFDALELMDRAAKRYRKQSEMRWDRTRRRILSGKAKFTTLEMRGPDRFFWRHTEWFAPPEKLEINPAWKVRSIRNAEEARTLWLNSFREPCAEKPLLWVVHPDDTSELYFNSQE